MNQAHRQSGDQDAKSARRALWAITFDANWGRKGPARPAANCFASNGSQKASNDCVDGACRFRYDNLQQGRLAQRLERSVYTRKVVRSNRTVPTIYRTCKAHSFAGTEFRWSNAAALSRKAPIRVPWLFLFFLNAFKEFGVRLCGAGYRTQEMSRNYFSPLSSAV
jgi:hypothetical protein